jgi:hypothetical protein
MVRRAALALEGASEKTDSLLVDAFRTGRSRAAGIRYAEALGDDEAATQFSAGSR